MWGNMVDELHVPVWNVTMKPLVNAWSGVRKELRGRDGGDKLTNVP
jgi:hypothetical protein